MFQTFSLSTATVGLILLVMCVQIALTIYDVFFGPLSQYPGPKLNAATRFIFAFYNLKGTEWKYVYELHLKYGHVVRVSPRDISYSNSRAWKDIYGQFSGTYAGVKTGQFQKDPTFYGETPPGFDELINAKDADHARMRRNFSNAFSEKAVRQQEPMIRRYVDLMSERLRDVALQPDNTIDIVRLSNFATFDIMADLTSGESLGCLQNDQYHPWVPMIFSIFRVLPVMQEISHYPWLAKMIELSMPKSVMEERMKHYDYSREMVDKRLARKNARPDIWGIALDAKAEYKLSLSEMYGNSRVFMTAGTETTATVVSGLVYYVLENPEKLELLTKEIRTTFSSPDEIKLDSLQNMQYLNACISEAMRIYPPLAGFLPRLVPKGGAIVCGEFVPEGVTVHIHGYSTCHLPSNFKNPDKFVPERWLGDPEYASDDRSAVQSFSMGPRNCIGKNLAYLEMRLLVASIFWHFDLTQLPESKGWPQKQKSFLIWEKNPLFVGVKLAPHLK